MAALSAFEFANIELGREAYRVTVMSEAGGPVRTSLGMVVDTAPFDDPPDTLMVLGRIVPQPPSPALRSFLVKCGAESRRVAGVCTGAFALADAGAARRTQRDDTLGSCPAAAATASRRAGGRGSHLHCRRQYLDLGRHERRIDLTLALIEDDHGAQISRIVARNLVVYHRRPGGQSQSRRCWSWSLAPIVSAVRWSMPGRICAIRSRWRSWPRPRASVRASSAGCFARKPGSRRPRPWSACASRRRKR